MMATDDMAAAEVVAVHLVRADDVIVERIGAGDPGWDALTVMLAAWRDEAARDDD